LGVSINNETNMLIKREVMGIRKNIQKTEQNNELKTNKQRNKQDLTL
jgi:hypothetical protein